MIDGKPIEWEVNDVFVVPPWKRYSHNTNEDAVLFSISDRPARRTRSASGGKGTKSPRSPYSESRLRCLQRAAVGL